MSNVAETVLNHETVHEVADDSTCSRSSKQSSGSKKSELQAVVEWVAEQHKDAANLLTKHRTTPVSPRKSPYGKRSKQADKETAAVTQLEANQAHLTNIGESVAQQLVELQLSCRTQTCRAEQLRRRLEARPQHIKRAEESQFESYPGVADSNSADCDVTRMCKEGAKCSERKTRPCYARGTTRCSTDAAV